MTLGRAGADRATIALYNFVSCLSAGDRSLAYVSTPITTGRVFLQWRMSLSHSVDEDSDLYNQDHRLFVLERNLVQARALVAAARARLARTVVDPTLLEVDGWRQADYHAFWTRLVAEAVDLIIMADGWEYSVGCVLEYTTAIDVGATVLNAEFQPLQHTEAIERVRIATAEYHKAGLDVVGLANLAESLDQPSASAVSSALRS